MVKRAIVIALEVACGLIRTLEVKKIEVRPNVAYFVTVNVANRTILDFDRHIESKGANYSSQKVFIV